MSDLSGKLGLVLGVANKRSISWAIAQAAASAGARIALTYPNARLEENVRELAATIPGSVVLPCDVTSDEQLAALGQGVADQFDHHFGLGVVHLEERRRAHVESRPAEFFDVGLLPGREIEPGDRRVHEKRAGLRRVAHLDLVQAGAVALQPRKQLLDPGVGDRALFGAQQAVPLAADVTDVAVLLPGRKAEVVAVPPRVGGAANRPHNRIIEAADAAELLADDEFLGGQLGGVAHVLQLAAAAFAEQGAARLDAIQRGLDDTRHNRLEVVRVLTFDERFDQFTRRGEGDEHHPPILRTGQAGAAEHERLDAHGHVRRLSRFLVAMTTARHGFEGRRGPP